MLMTVLAVIGVVALLVVGLSSEIILRAFATVFLRPFCSLMRAPSMGPGGRGVCAAQERNSASCG